MMLVHAIFLGLSAAAPAAEPIPAKPAAEDVRVMHDFSACVAKYRSKGARSVLALDYRTETYGEAIRKLADSDFECKPKGKLRFNTVLFAGGVAEQLLEHDLGDAPLALRIAHDPSRPALEARDDGEYTGLCTVRRAPEEVATLLRAEPASGEEKEALKAVGSALSACVPNGSTARFNAPGLRSLLALAAYRLAAHNAPATGN